MSLPAPQCGACGVAFDSIEASRKHYQSDFHVHNVRMRVEGKRPVTAQEYKHMRIAEGIDVDNDGGPSFACKLCKKTFHCVQTLQAHVRSTAHLIKKEQRILARDSDAASALTSTSLGSAAVGLHRRHNAKRPKALSEGTKKTKEVKVQPEEREEDVSEVRCFACGALSDNVEANLEHLFNVHEFTIPLQEKCTDVAGLLSYVARKTNGLLCLVCGEKTRSFASLEALRAHMREKNHDRIILGPEYDEFYSISLADVDVGERLDLNNMELVVSDSRRCVQRREAEVPRPRKKDSNARIEQHRLLIAAQYETQVALRREEREEMREVHREAHKLLKRQDAHYQEHMMKVSLRSNKLHPKGYDGEGRVN
ncbi:zinc finger protein, conserved [Trypanosoma brucei brucei TREU927]|uniref:Zinc finger protein, conserved n=1 Tax=Trypanosoma brucei brucei (strain 927/4 GUTat10.1) TaxID=185431 RepID=Q584Z4_TRYB2|nr:zinc finger protein, conserved [Trypanosoma brucei brucei TREU927]AAX79928.1 zinc finger protein, conserved [Trypanosoma brucei]AAZ11913.1 zinc finger protein, conserved [Trypanosoma brucei brucei TREU927]